MAETPPWPGTAALFATSVKAYHLARGIPAREASVRANSELVPARGAAILRAVSDAGVNPLESRLLEVGCGFGSLAAYFAKSGVPSVLACDVRSDYVTLAEATVEMAGLSPAIEFAVADVLDLRGVPDASVDVAVAAGVLLHLDRERDLPRAVAALRRALRPGGCLAIYQANPRWLPARLRGRFREVRPQHAAEILEELNATGFQGHRLTGLARDRVLPRPLARLGSYYVVAVRAPA